MNQHDAIIEIDLTEQEQFNIINTYIKKHFNGPSCRVFENHGSQLTSFDDLYQAAGKALINQAINEIIEFTVRQSQQMELPL